MPSEADGAVAVALARETVAYGLARGGAIGEIAARIRDRPLSPWFEERRGLFVTLSQGPDDRLRGCIGFPRPAYPLRVAIPLAAWAAATEDPRFPPLAARELAGTRFELSVLSRPSPLPDPTDRAASVRVGRDGLLVERGEASGLLLPQVPVEAGWEAEQFLRETCRKAGLPATAWKDPRTRVLSFQAEIFREQRPGGPVVGRPLTEGPG